MNNLNVVLFASISDISYVHKLWNTTFLKLNFFTFSYLHMGHVFYPVDCGQMSRIRRRSWAVCIWKIVAGTSRHTHSPVLTTTKNINIPNDFPFLFFRYHLKWNTGLKKQTNVGSTLISVKLCCLLIISIQMRT